MREFCGVDLAKWLSEEENTDFCLRLKKNEYLELNGEIKTLEQLGLQREHVFLLSRSKNNKN
jgi:hypothetical protein